MTCSSVSNCQKVELTPFERKALPWADKAARISIVAMGVFLSPTLFFVSFAVGTGVGFAWPAAEKIDITQTSIGCSQSFLEWLADGKQSPVAVLIISTLFFAHHMEHAKELYVPVAGFMVGQSAGRALHHKICSLTSAT